MSDGIDNLRGAIEAAHASLADCSDETNPYYSPMLLENQGGYLRGLRIAMQIVEGARQ